MYDTIRQAEAAAGLRECPMHGFCPAVAVRRAWSSLQIVIEYACGRKEHWNPDLSSRAV